VRLGARRGRMIVPAVSLAVAAVPAIVGVQVQNAWLGVVILSVGAALCWANEGPVWAGPSTLLPYRRWVRREAS
jgi:hypothetical protein